MAYGIAKKETKEVLVLVGDHQEFKTYEEGDEVVTMSSSTAQKYVKSNPKADVTPIVKVNVNKDENGDVTITFPKTRTPKIDLNALL